MLKTSSRAILVGLVLYAGYLFGASYFFQLEYKWPFLIAAGYYAFMYLVMHLDYKAESECKVVTNSDRKIRLLPDNKFVTASFLSIVMLIIAVTLPLATIYLNQKGVCQVNWLYQVLAALVGVGFAYSTSLPYSRRCYVPYALGDNPRVEAEKIVRDIVYDVFPYAEKEGCSMSTSLVNDLDADEVDLEEIFFRIDEVTEQVYGRSVFVIYPYEEGLRPKLKSVLELCLEYLYHPRCPKLTMDRRLEFYAKLNQCLPTVGDYVDIVAAGIVFLRGKV